jgi:dipicolinate synthase subunit A
MILDRSFCLIGGDARQLALRDLLVRDGARVTSLFLSNAQAELSAAADADCVLLPMPVEGTPGQLFAPQWPEPISVAPVLDALQPKQLIFAGKVGLHLHTMAHTRGLTLRDYLLREELAIANAVPTAEGALAAAMEALPITIHGSRVLVTGFGRVGQCTAQRFRALGAVVSVAARRPGQLALAASMDCRPIPLSRLRGDFDLVVNTVPTVILTREVLSRLGRPILLELASAPGGFDRNAATELALPLIPAPNLPGRVAPVTAARAIQRTLYHMLEELDP